jgi:hypothetical protein
MAGMTGNAALRMGNKLSILHFEIYWSEGREFFGVSGFVSEDVAGFHTEAV